MKYTASSVKKEIESKKTLVVNGGLQCPQDTGWIQSDGTQCPQIPSACLHTRAGTCKQRVHIHERGPAREVKLVILTFYFTISSTNHDGYIDAQDRQLERLVNCGRTSKRYLIDTAQFDTVQSE
jgi:hypothetical protein